MGLIASLSGHSVTHASLSIPAWGAWYADVSLDAETALAGAVTLQIADLTLKGTILSGGASSGRAHYRIVAGAAGWGKTLPRKSYANDAGVKVSTVLGDAAKACGETIDVSSNTDRAGPAFVRDEDQACRLLEHFVPGGWYIDELGTTRLGARPASALDAKVPRVSPVDRARGTVTLAPTSLAALLPGVVVDGLDAVDVMHEISAKGGLRTTIWGRQGAGGSRQLAALRALFEQFDPDRKYRGVTEYRVVTQEGKRLNLQPVRVSTGMPDLARVPMRPGVSGADSTVALGSRVLVGFADSDRARPYVAGFEDADGEGFKPTTTRIDASTSLTLANGSLFAARVTDAVVAGPFGGTITAGSSKVKVG